MQSCGAANCRVANYHFPAPCIHVPFSPSPPPEPFIEQFNTPVVAMLRHQQVGPWRVGRGARKGQPPREPHALAKVELQPAPPLAAHHVQQRERGPGPNAIHADGAGAVVGGDDAEVGQAHRQAVAVAAGDGCCLAQGQQCAGNGARVHVVKGRWLPGGVLHA